MDRRSVKLAAPILTVVSIKIVHLDLVAILVSLMVSLVGIVNQWVSLKISPPTPRRRAVELPSRLVDRPPTPLCPASPLPPMPAPSTAPAGSVAPPMSVVPPPVTAPVAIPVRMGSAPAAPRPALPAVATVCRRVGAVRPRRVTMPKAARPGVDPTKPVVWFVISKSPAPPPIPVPTPRVPSVGYLQDRRPGRRGRARSASSGPGPRYRPGPCPALRAADAGSRFRPGTAASGCRLSRPVVCFSWQKQVRAS
jgi:hypothetical protein